MEEKEEGKDEKEMECVCDSFRVSGIECENIYSVHMCDFLKVFLRLSRPERPKFVRDLGEYRAESR